MIHSEEHYGYRHLIWWNKITNNSKLIEKNCIKVKLNTSVYSAYCWTENSKSSLRVTHVRGRTNRPLPLTRGIPMLIKNTHHTCTEKHRHMWTRKATEMDQGVGSKKATERDQGVGSRKATLMAQGVGSRKATEMAQGVGSMRATEMDQGVGSVTICNIPT